MPRKKSPQHKARIKIWLLRGRKLTQAIAIEQWKCYRLSEYIRRLRKDGFRIDMELKYNSNGTCYGVYKHVI